ncbi:MAG: hypothetical protein LBB66_10425 [Desulfovibrio sp.]|jgi:hypothetical protein|nr:hypothetical protein [Desulfovibrio sp.]
MTHTENSLWETLLPLMRLGVAAFPDTEVARAYQPGTQSGGDKPRVVLHRVSSRRYGAQGQRLIRDHRPDGSLRITERSVWRKEDTFQANALVDRRPEDAEFTAKDVLEGLAEYLQGRAAVVALRRAGLGILRIGEITETPYEDEADVYRISVGLKFVITYTYQKFLSRIGLSIQQLCQLIQVNLLGTSSLEELLNPRRRKNENSYSFSLLALIA